LIFFFIIVVIIFEIEINCNYKKVWDASGLTPEKLGGQNNDQPKSRTRIKKIVDDDSNFIMKNQKFTVENEESPPQKNKNSKMEQEDHEFYQQYTRKKNHGLNTRPSDFDEP
jgi:hypothetical protein